MLLCSIFLLLLSNSLNFRRDISIYYSRIGIIMLLYCIYFSYNNIFLSYLDPGIGLFGGLFNISTMSLIIQLLIFLFILLILIIPGFLYKKSFSPTFYLIANIKQLDFLGLTLIKKSPYITSLMDFVLIIFGIFTLLLFIILIIILFPIILYFHFNLIQYNIIDDSIIDNFKIPKANFDIPMANYCYGLDPRSREIPHPDFSNIPDYIDPFPKRRLDPHVLMRIVENQRRALLSEMTDCIIKRDRVNYLFNTYIDSIQYDAVNDNYIYRSKPGLTPLQFYIYKTEMLQTAARVQERARFIRTYTLAKFKMGEAQYYREMPRDLQSFTLNTPSQYLRIHRILNQYENRYWFHDSGLRTQNWNWHNGRFTQPPNPNIPYENVG